MAALVAGALLTPAALALLAMAGRLPSDAVSEPPLWEADLGRKALAASLRRRAVGLANPVAAGDEAAARAPSGPSRPP